MADNTITVPEAAASLREGRMTWLVHYMSANDSTNGLWFSITLGDEEFIAFISADALRIHFNATDKPGKALLRTYLQHQPLIDDAARRKFLGGAARPIKLSVGDF